MEEFKCKPFAVPGGGDTITQEMCKALGVWLDENFAEFKRTNLGGDVFIKAVTEALEKSGVNAAQLKELKEQVEEFGKTVDRIKHGGMGQQPKSRNQAIRDFVKEHHKEFVNAGSNFSLPINKDAAIITTSNAVTSDTSAVYTGYTVREDGIYYKRHNRQYIRDIANVRRLRNVPQTYQFWEEGSEQGTFAVVAENGLKPLVQTSLVLNQVSRTKVAGHMTLTEEVLMDPEQLAERLIALADDKLQRDYEDKLSSEISTNAASYTTTALDDTIAAPNNFDAIAAGALTLSSLNFRPEVLVLNPADAYAMMVEKDNTGRYLLPVVTNGGQLNILGLEVIISGGVDAGKFVLAEYGAFQVREGEAIIRSGLNEDDFVNNRRTFVLEVFTLFFLPSNYEGAILEGDFATIKEALKAPDAAA